VHFPEDRSAADVPTPGALRARLERGGFVVAGLGDSLTYGWMVRRGFFDRCVDALSGRQAQAAISRINAGVPGDTAPGGFLRAAGVLAARPDAVAIQFGLNDCYSGVSPGEYDAAVRRIADLAVRAGSLPILVTSCPTDLADGPAAMDPYYGALRALAAERSFPLADVDAACTPRTKGTRSWPRSSSRSSRRWYNLIRAGSGRRMR
jgi:lysophospholipase L1-like esterase